MNEQTMEAPMAARATKKADPFQRHPRRGMA
jgi:hypothetical protein